MTPSSRLISRKDTILTGSGLSSPRGLALEILQLWFYPHFFPGISFLLASGCF